MHLGPNLIVSPDITLSFPCYLSLESSTKVHKQVLISWFQRLKENCLDSLSRRDALRQNIWIRDMIQIHCIESERGPCFNEGFTLTKYQRNLDFRVWRKMVQIQRVLTLSFRFILTLSFLGFSIYVGIQITSSSLKQSTNYFGPGCFEVL